MSLTCPNQNMPAWKTLVKEVGEELAHLAYQRHGDIPDVETAKRLLLPRTDPAGSPARDTADISYSTVEPLAAFDPKEAREWLVARRGDKPLDVRIPSRRDYQTNGRFAGPRLAGWFLDRMRSTLTDSRLSTSENLQRVFDHIEKHAPDIDPHQFASALEANHFLDAGEMADPVAAKLVSDMGEAFDAAFGEPGEVDTTEAAADKDTEDLEASRAATAGVYDSTGGRMAAHLEKNDEIKAFKVAVAAALPGIKNTAQVLRHVQFAFDREAALSPGYSGYRGDSDVSKLGEWLKSAPQEPLVGIYHKFLNGLVGVAEDGSPDLAPVYKFLGPINGLRPNMTTLVERGGSGMLVRHQYDTGEATQVDDLPEQASHHLSDETNLKRFLDFAINGETSVNSKGKSVAYPPLFRTTENGKLRSDLSTHTGAHRKPDGTFDPAATALPVYHPSEFQLNALERKAADYEAEAKKADAAGNGSLAAVYRDRGQVAKFDELQRRRLAHWLEMIHGDMPELKAALLNEISIASLSGTPEKPVHPFSYFANDLKQATYDLARAAQGHLAGTEPNFKLRVEDILRDLWLGTRKGAGGAADRNSAEQLFGAFIKSHTREAPSPVQADGKKAAGQRYLAPIDIRVQANQEIKDALRKRYSEAEVAQWARHGVIDGVASISVFAGARNLSFARDGLEPADEEYQQGPGSTPSDVLDEALIHAYENPDRGVHKDWVSFRMPNAGSGTSLILTLPRDLFPAGTTYDLAWEKAVGMVNKPVEKVRAKDVGAFNYSQGPAPLKGVPGGLPDRPPLLIHLGQVDKTSGNIVPGSDQILDGKSYEDHETSKQAALSTGVPDRRVIKDAIVDANGTTYLKTSTHAERPGAIAGSSSLHNWLQSVRKIPELSRGLLSDKAGSKPTGKPPAKAPKVIDVEINGATHRFEISDYDLQSRRQVAAVQHPANTPRGTATENSNIQAHTMLFSWAGGSQNYHNTLNYSMSGLGLRAAANKLGAGPTKLDRAQGEADADSAELLSRIALAGKDPLANPLVGPKVAQREMADIQDIANISSKSIHAVLCPSGGRMMPDGSVVWLGGKADPVLSSKYHWDETTGTLIKPTLRNNDNDPTARNAQWPKAGWAGVYPEIKTEKDLKDLVVSHVLNMRNNNIPEGLRQKEKLLHLFVNELGKSLYDGDHFVSFDDMVTKEGEFDESFHQPAEGNFAPEGAEGSSKAFRGTLYHKVSRPPITTGASSMPMHKMGAYSYVEKEGKVGRIKRDYSGYKEVVAKYTGDSDANEASTHPARPHYAGEDYDADSLTAEKSHAKSFTGVAYGNERGALTGKDLEPKALVDRVRMEIADEFKSDSEKYGTDEEVATNQQFAQERQRFAKSRIEQAQLESYNHLADQELKSYEDEAKALGGKNIFGTWLAPKTETSKFKDPGTGLDRRVPQARGPGDSEWNRFFGKIDEKQRAEIEARLTKDGHADTLDAIRGEEPESLTFVDVPHWLRVRIANGPETKVTRASSALRADLLNRATDARGQLIQAGRIDNQVTRPLHATMKIAESALLDEKGMPLFPGGWDYDPTKLSPQDLRRSWNLIDASRNIDVNANLDAPKEDMPSTAASGQATPFVAIKETLIAASLFKSPEEIVAFDSKFMKWMQTPAGEAVYKTLMEADRPDREELKNLSGKVLLSARDRMKKRLADAYAETGLSGDRIAPAVKAFMHLIDASDALRTADSVVNVGKGNVGSADALVKLESDIGKMAELQRGYGGPKGAPTAVHLREQTLSEGARDRAAVLLAEGKNLFQHDPLSSEEGHFGRTCLDALGSLIAESKGVDPGDFPMRQVGPTAARGFRKLVTANQLALAAASRLPENLLQRYQGPEGSKNLLNLAEAALMKGYLQDPYNAFYSGLQAPSEGRFLKRISSRNQAKTLGKARLQPIWEDAMKIRELTISPKDTHASYLTADVTLSPTDIRNLMYFYAVSVHGAHLGGWQGGFLRMLPPETHMEVSDAMNRFNDGQADAFSGDASNPISLANSLATKFRERGRGKGDRGTFGVNVLQAPLEFADAFRGGVEKPAEKTRVEAPRAAPEAAPEIAEPKTGGVTLTGTSPYLGKDQVKSDKASKFIGRGSPSSSTAAYARDWAERANSGAYSSADRVFISAEGNRTGRLGPDFGEIQKALDARATIITDDESNRTRLYNRGEREVSGYLAKAGYVETKPGEWTPPAAPKNERIISPAIQEDGSLVTGVNHAEAYKQLHPEATGKEIADARAGTKAGFVVSDDAGNTRFANREEAMKIARRENQALAAYSGEEELESHMVDYNARREYSVLEDGKPDSDYYEALWGEEFGPDYEKKYPEYFNARRAQFIRQTDDHRPLMDQMREADQFPPVNGENSGDKWEAVRKDFAGRMSDGTQFADPNDIKARTAFLDRMIWEPILSAKDYESAVKAWNAIDASPENGKLRYAARKLIEDYPTAQWEQHRADQATKNPDGPQGQYAILRKQFEMLPGSDQANVAHTLGLTPAKALESLRQETLILGKVGHRTQAFADAVRGKQGELGIEYSTVEPPDLSISERDDNLFGVLNTDAKIQAQLPDKLGYQPNIAQKPQPPAMSPEEIKKQAAVMQDVPAQEPLGKQEDYKAAPLPPGIKNALPLSGAKADVVSGWTLGAPPDWKVETLFDSTKFAMGMLDHRIKLEGPRALFATVETYAAFAQQGLTAARLMRRHIQELLGTTNEEGKLSTYKTLSRPEVDISALSDPNKPLTTGETTEGQAVGIMGGYAPWKGAGGKVGQVDAFDKDERRQMYWVDVALSSWAAGEGHENIPTALTVSRKDDYVSHAIGILKKAQKGPNPMPEAIATELIARLGMGDTSFLIDSEAAGKYNIAVPADLVEKTFMESSARKKLVATGRRAEDLTRENLVKIARDHFDSEYTRVNENVPFLITGEDAFGTYIDKMANYIPMKHGSGPIAHSVDQIEKDLDFSLSGAINAQAQREENDLGARMAPDRALIDVGERLGLPELTGTKVPWKLGETPTWVLERLHDAWARERTMEKFPGRAIFLRKVREGEYDKMGLLPQTAGYADAVRALHDSTMRTLIQRKLAAETAETPIDGINPVQLARALRTQLKDQPGEEPTFAKTRAFKSHEDAWRTAGLLPSSYGFTDLVADYGNRQMAALSRKLTLNQLMMAEDIDGRPLVLALPNLDFEDAEGVISNTTWEHAARKWAAYYKVPYDEAKSGKENAHRIVSSNVTGQSSDHFEDRFKRKFQYSVVPTAYGSVSQWYGQQDLPGEANVMDMFVGGEASAALRQVMETHDLWNANRVMGGVQEINNWMKVNALQLSLFHVKALLEDVESATWGKALLPKALRAKDPSHITLGEWYRMLKTNDPYVHELTKIMDQVGITQSYGNVNPVDIATGKLDKHVDKMRSWLKTAGHERMGDDFKAVSDMLSNEQSSFIFESLNNIGKLAVTHSLLQRARAEAYKTGRTFDPVKALKPYNRYVNEAVGGLNPAHYSWATPHARQVMSLGLFSWQWTLGAWNAAGGSLLTGGILDTKLTPEASRFIFTRRLPAMVAMVMIAEPMAMQLATYLSAAAAGKTKDDDHPWLWDNEDGKKSYADLTPIARMMPGYNGGTTGQRRLYIRWGKQVHEILNWLEDPMKTAGGKSSLVAQTAFGLATGRSLGTDWNLGFKNEGLAGFISGRHGFEDSRLAYLTENMIPVVGSFSVSQVLKNPGAGLLGLTGPTSQGTSYHAACQRAMAVLSAWTENDHFRTFQYNQKTQVNLHALLADILDDARANGYPPEQVLNASRAAILKAKYADLYATMSNKGVDQAAFERVSREIMRLNGTVQGIRSSVANRNHLYGKPGTLTPAENEAIAEAFHEPEPQRRREEAKAAKPKKPKPADQFAALREYADSLKKDSDK